MYCFFCKKPNTYAVLFSLGMILPLYFLGLFIWTNGFDLKLMLNLIMINNVSAAVGMDALMSAITTTVLVIFDGYRKGMRWFWLPILVTWTVGACAGLPLFLLMQSLSCDTVCSI